ncbi:MAG: folylpolyglutamate synthase/dihydrofolate synthase family protein [Pseudomonadota bacterium]
MKDAAADLTQVLLNLETRRPKSIDLSLSRIRTALERLGDPQDACPPIFHVAGTNGKGSTIAFLRAMLEGADHSVHVYTSPHLVNFNERIVLAGREAADSDIIQALSSVDRAAGADPLTYFETITCAAFLMFSRTPADYLLLEVGLGGRLDATNVISAPVATLVTPVGLDHQEYLGSNVTGIAREKAGIFKAGVPAIIGKQTPDALAVLRSAADEQGAPVFAAGAEWDCYAEHGKFIYQQDNGLWEFPLPRLAGRHQIDNAGLAVAALFAGGLKLNDSAIENGILRAAWPARMQRLRKGPLIDLALSIFGEGAEIWLDGGHNPHAAQVVAQTISDMNDRSPKPLQLIVGMQSNKDPNGFLSPFDGLARSLVALRSSQASASPPERIVAAATHLGLSGCAANNIEDAIRHFENDALDGPPRILICGSLYLAGDVLAENS